MFYVMRPITQYTIAWVYDVRHSLQIVIFE